MATRPCSPSVCLRILQDPKWKLSWQLPLQRCVLMVSQNRNRASASCCVRLRSSLMSPHRPSSTRLPDRSLEVRMCIHPSLALRITSQRMSLRQRVHPQDHTCCCSICNSVQLPQSTLHMFACPRGSGRRHWRSAVRCALAFSW